ncbi:multicopper oxidase domain-containing protein [Gilvimarinus sp. F26214L]|uniref:multicopper oxidase domain-containing protein n=1 Tax=Gilvimarinus sp. DZF01 TaxID=3461371 RepID=UPI004045AAAA
MIRATRALTFSLPLLLAAAFAQPVVAKTVKVDMEVKEAEIAVDNAGNTQRMWTFGGAIPGPLVRVKEGDLVQFTLHNHEDNGNSHSMDFHAARVDVLDEFAEVKPGESKSYEFSADYPGVFIYHCGADSMAEHISRGMYGVIIVDPKDGYSKEFPKPDREYVLVQGDLFAEGTSVEDITMGKGWEAALINGKVFHYDPVHDPNASLTMEAEPGERVRVFYVNASINEAAAVHPIAGIWDRVWDNGHPKNISHGLQTVDIAPAHGMVLDIIPPAGRDSNNAIVDHRMKNAMNGAISVLMTYKGADSKKGRDGNLILR